MSEGRQTSPCGRRLPICDTLGSFFTPVPAAVIFALPFTFAMRTPVTANVGFINACGESVGTAMHYHLSRRHNAIAYRCTPSGLRLRTSEGRQTSPDSRRLPICDTLGSLFFLRCATKAASR
ncbi:MAG: hypothetical protein ACI3YG_00290 [Prevotella sp.]